MNPRPFVLILALAACGPAATPTRDGPAPGGLSLPETPGAAETPAGAVAAEAPTAQEAVTAPGAAETTDPAAVTTDAAETTGVAVTTHDDTVGVAAGGVGATAPAAVPPGEAPAAPPAGAKPASVDALRSLLGARHTRDLPKRPQVMAYAEARASLHWIALHEEKGHIAARAYDRMGFWDDPETVAALVAAVKDDGLSSELRRGALLGIGRQDLANRPDLREVLTDEIRGADVKRGLEAVRLLKRVEPARPELEAIEGISGPVGDALRAALGR